MLPYGWFRAEGFITTDAYFKDILKEERSIFSDGYLNLVSKYLPPYLPESMKPSMSLNFTLDQKAVRHLPSYGGIVHPFILGVTMMMM